MKGNDGEPLKQYHHISVDQDFKKDCKIWKVFSDNAKSFQGLTRPFVDLGTSQFAYTLNFYSDASLNRNFGLGAVFGNRWIVGTWGKKFITEQKLSIEFLKLFVLFAAIMTWSNSSILCNTCFVVFCDNKSVRDMVNSFTSRCPKCMKILRLLALDGIKYNRRVFVKYVKSKANTLADTLSRLDYRKFWKHAPTTMKAWPDTIPGHIWPIEKIWYNEKI